jgi:glycosyltransferase involved in cell wall biosynthesis
MRITCISAARIPSDTANSIQVMKVCQALAQLGHEVVLFVPGPQEKGLEPLALQKHYGLHTLFSIEWLPVRSRRFFPWVAVRRARRIDADLLYVWPIQAAALGRMYKRLPVLLEMHDLPSGSFGPVWFWLFKRQKGPRRVLPITQALRKMLEKRYGGWKEAELVIAPDGVDLERYAALPDPSIARQNMKLPPVPTVVCTGHLYAGRGVDLFLGLAERLPQVAFVWAGGRTADVERMRQKAQGLANVLFTGFLPQESMPMLQAAADVLLMPYQESVATSSGGNTAAFCSPMKMFEYMAAGRAILSSDLPVLHEVLDESTAVFCPPDDLNAWVNALIGLLSDEGRRQKLGEAARAGVEKYTWLERARKCLQGFEGGSA